MLKKMPTRRKLYGGEPAVTGVSFDVARGETFGLLDANGAGKTTTLECLLGVRTTPTICSGSTA